MCHGSPSLGSGELLCLAAHSFAQVGSILARARVCLERGGAAAELAVLTRELAQLIAELEQRRDARWLQRYEAQVFGNQDRRDLAGGEP